MSRRTKVRIKRMLLLLFLFITTVGTIYALVRSLLLRQIVGLLFAAGVMTLIGEWMGAGPDETDTGILQDKAKWRCKSADNQ